MEAKPTMLFDTVAVDDSAAGATHNPLSAFVGDGIV
jgi:hypothetical protein